MKYELVEGSPFRSVCSDEDAQASVGKPEEALEVELAAPDRVQSLSGTNLILIATKDIRPGEKARLLR